MLGRFVADLRGRPETTSLPIPSCQIVGVNTNVLVTLQMYVLEYVICIPVPALFSLLLPYTEYDIYAYEAVSLSSAYIPGIVAIYLHTHIHIHIYCIVVSLWSLQTPYVQVPVS